MNNPPWVTKVVHNHCDAIRAEAERLSLPMPKIEGKCKIIGELGSGHYGTVYQTDTPGIVFKVSSDETEAHFVATAIKLREAKHVDPEGIVEYFAIRALPEKYRGRNVFILWREEAVSVGIDYNVYAKDYESVSKRKFIQLLMRFKYCSHEAKIIADNIVKKGDAESYWSWIQSSTQEATLERMSEEYNELAFGEKSRPQDDSFVNILINRYKGDPKRRFSWLVECCHQISMEMINENQYSYLVGGALGDYLEAGLLLADVHGNNVGVVDRPDHSNAVVITDPGHLCVLKRSLSSPEVKVLRPENA